MLSKKVVLSFTNLASTEAPNTSEMADGQKLS